MARGKQKKNEYEERWDKLLRMKMVIQKLTSERNEKQAQAQKLRKEAYNLSTQIHKLETDMFEFIQ